MAAATADKAVSDWHWAPQFAQIACTAPDGPTPAPNAVGVAVFWLHLLVPLFELPASDSMLDSCRRAVCDSAAQLARCDLPAATDRKRAHACVRWRQLFAALQAAKDVIGRGAGR